MCFPRISSKPATKPSPSTSPSPSPPKPRLIHVQPTTPHRTSYHVSSIPQSRYHIYESQPSPAASHPQEITLIPNYLSQPSVLYEHHCSTILPSGASPSHRQFNSHHDHHHQLFCGPTCSSCVPPKQNSDDGEATTKRAITAAPEEQAKKAADEEKKKTASEIAKLKADLAKKCADDELEKKLKQEREIGVAVGVRVGREISGGRGVNRPSDNWDRPRGRGVDMGGLGGSRMDPFLQGALAAGMGAGVMSNAIGGALDALFTGSVIGREGQRGLARVGGRGGGDMSLREREIEELVERHVGREIGRVVGRGRALGIWSLDS